MKATLAGAVVGQALESYNASGTGQILILVNPGYYPGADATSYVQNGGNAILSGLTVGGTSDFADLNSSGTATIDNLVVTSSATIASLEVTGSAQFDGNITVDGHIITGGNTPTAQAQPNAGQNAVVTVSGNDTLGTITITTGTNPTPGDIAQLIFNKAYAEAPKVLISPANDNASLMHFYRGTTTSTGFMLDFTDIPAANTTYQYDYFGGQ
jgi:hypothetical protein